MILSLDVNFWFLTAYKSYLYTVDRNNQEAIYNRGRKEFYSSQTRTIAQECSPPQERKCSWKAWFSAQFYILSKQKKDQTWQRYIPSSFQKRQISTYRVSQNELGVWKRKLFFKEVLASASWVRGFYPYLQIRHSKQSGTCVLFFVIAYVQCMSDKSYDRLF